MSKVRIGILGCGGMAGAHAGRFKANPDCEIVALCDVSEERVEAFIKRCLGDYPTKPTIYTDPATMYAEAKLDGVAIVTPHTLHYEQGVQALEAGVNVLMEKPMVTDSDQAHALAAKVKETGKLLVIGYNTPCTPEFAYLRELIRSEELGKLELISGWLTQNWRKGTKGTWRQEPSLSGGGQMYDSGAHLFNSLVWLVEQPVDQVQAFVDNLDTPVDINGSVNIRFASGTFATIVIGGNCPDSGAGLMLAFDNGRVEVDGWGGSWIKVWKNGQPIKYPHITGATGNPMDNFVAALLGKDDPKTSVANGIIQSELMDAIYESARTGCVAKVKAR